MTYGERRKAGCAVRLLVLDGGGEERRRGKQYGGHGLCLILR